MHCILLGVTKMLLKSWFNSENSKELWYCGNQVKKADAKLLQIKPPTIITRASRSIAVTGKLQNIMHGSSFTHFLLC